SPEANPFRNAERTAWLSGVVTDIYEQTEGSGQIIAISFPNENSRTWSTVNVVLLFSQARMDAVDASGQCVGFPTEAGNVLWIPIESGQGSETTIGYNPQTRSFSFPTEQGHSMLRIGDPIVATIDLAERNPNADGWKHHS